MYSVPYVCILRCKERENISKVPVCAPTYHDKGLSLSPLKPGLLTLLPWYVWSKELSVQYGTVSILSLDIEMNISANGIDLYNNMHMEYLRIVGTKFISQIAYMRISCAQLPLSPVSTGQS
jgi:hypothetical protein